MTAPDLDILGGRLGDVTQLYQRQAEHITDDVLFSIGLLRLCETLRMSCNGSGDRLDTGVEAKVFNYLRSRLTKWIPTGRRPSPYDEAVRTLVACTLDEVARS